jgi:hypothetical protein
MSKRFYKMDDPVCRPLLASPRVGVVKVVQHIRERGALGLWTDVPVIRRLLDHNTLPFPLHLNMDYGSHKAHQILPPLSDLYTLSGAKGERECSETVA